MALGLMGGRLAGPQPGWIRKPADLEWLDCRRVSLTPTQGVVLAVWALDTNSLARHRQGCWEKMLDPQFL